ncbi:lipocalin family protein [Hyunsoonleella sp. SJ7]|uniref:Lipocalin family protein n=1 Tax=Hyunsoonleella aquatilis TaxID=2762758 RepID=A0A923KK57_9FLAO|nr:lipocalin family protein [Hyunsoonleella aquatilis]MBC3757478.1 lipocalin family protein [Hyunsoonleella aquatilis]
MKKNTLLLISLVLVFSCSSNDSEFENVTPNLELLVNQWFFIESKDLRLPEGQQEYFANECEQNRFIQFTANGAFLEKFYYLHPNNGCIEDGTINGTFELTNSTSLKLTESDGEVNLYEIRNINSNQLSIEYLKDKEIYTYKKN